MDMERKNLQELFQDEAAIQVSEAEKAVEKSFMEDASPKSPEMADEPSAETVPVVEEAHAELPVEEFSQETLRVVEIQEEVPTVDIPILEEELQKTDSIAEITEVTEEPPEEASAEEEYPAEENPEIMDNLQEMAGIVEALIFVSGDPVPVKRLVDVLEITDENVRATIDFLNTRYIENDSGLQIMEVAGGFQMRTRTIYSSYVNRYLERKKKVSLSGPALESLAIIAYKQPITRAEVEAIRGVAVDGVLKSLLDKRLIKVVGVKEVIGKPNLYGTTKHFLEYFGLNSLADLPPIEDISKTFSSGSALQANGEPAEMDTEIESGDETETGAENASSPPQPAQPETQPE